MHRPLRRKPRTGPRYRRRIGSLTFQLILVLPILLIATIGIIQLGFLVTLRQAVYHAATVAAREAAKGADIDRVAAAVNSVLRPHNLQVGDVVGVTLEDVAVSSTPAQAGQVLCAPPTEPQLNNDEVRVSVCVDLTQHPLGNTLAVLGIGTVGRTIRASSVATKELP